MGHKKLCIKCRLTFSREFDDGLSNRKYPCPSCGEEMILLPHRFRPPKKTDEIKWKTVQFLLSKGFRYQHEVEEVPENLREAKEFLQKIQLRDTSPTKSNQ